MNVKDKLIQGEQAFMEKFGEMPNALLLGPRERKELTRLFLPAWFRSYISPGDNIIECMGCKVLKMEVDGARFAIIGEHL